MPRRAKYLDDDDPDSSEDGMSDQDFPDDPDLAAEQEMFQDPARKRRRVMTKEDQLYGIWNDEGPREHFKDANRRRAAYNKDVQFVGKGSNGNGPKADNNSPSPKDDDDDEFEVAGRSRGKTGNIPMEMDPEDMVGYEDADAPPIFSQINSSSSGQGGGLGYGNSTGTGGLGYDSPTTARGLGYSTPPVNGESGYNTPTTGGLGYNPPAGGLGFAAGTGGLGSINLFAPDISDLSRSNTPNAFGSSSRKSNLSKFRSAPRQNGGLGPSSQSARNMGSFEQHTKGFGSKMLAKMGYVAGTGLGSSGQGIVNPIEARLRGGKVGLGAIDEMTKKARAEAIRMGRLKATSDDEPEPKGRKPTVKNNAWKKSAAPKRPKKEYKTAEEIMLEASIATPPAAVKIIDMTGKQVREVQSVASAISSPTPDGSMFLPELRHNLALIVSMAQGDLEIQAREIKNLTDRKVQLDTEEDKMTTQTQEQEDELRIVEGILQVVGEMEQIARHVSANEPSLAPFEGVVLKMLPFSQYTDEYKLDEAVVGAIAPTLKRLLADWKPLEEPSIFTPQVKTWSSLLQIDTRRQEQQMFAYSSLIWNLWLPRVRTAFNSDWDVHEPAAAVKLIETWRPYLPAFIFDNIIDQLILPKLMKSVEEWKVSLHGKRLPAHAWVFPWLEVIEPIRLRDALDIVKRKLTSAMRSWRVTDGLVQDLAAWKEVLEPREMDSILIPAVLEKLGSSLREDLEINPRYQDMSLLDLIVPWREVFRESTFSTLFDMSFFPKWLDVLHMWLTHDPNLEEVSKWYSFWRGYFPSELHDMRAFKRGFSQGIDLMNQALSLGPDTKTRLQHPAANKVQDKMKTGERPVNPTPRVAPAADSSSAFKNLVEEYLSGENLLLVPTQRGHSVSGKALFKVAKTPSARGVTCYIEDDVLWMQQGADFVPMTLEDLVQAANNS